MYKDFAYIYDSLARDFDYENWLNKALGWVESLNGPKGLVADLACGTGTLTEMLEKCGWSCIGIDISADMLNVAREKCPNSLLLMQDIAEFELYGTVDLIVCACDSLNYILSEKRLKNLFRLVANYLNPGGIFVFDVNTLHKMQQVLANNTFCIRNQPVVCIWENQFDEKRQISRHYLEFFVKNNAETYNRFTERHLQRYHPIEKLVEIGLQNQLKLQKLTDEFTQNQPTETSQRVMIAMQKMPQ